VLVVLIRSIEGADHGIEGGSTCAQALPYLLERCQLFVEIEGERRLELAAPRTQTLHLVLKIAEHLRDRRVAALVIVRQYRRHELDELLLRLAPHDQLLHHLGGINQTKVIIGDADVDALGCLLD